VCVRAYVCAGVCIVYTHTQVSQLDCKSMQTVGKKQRILQMCRSLNDSRLPTLSGTSYSGQVPPWSALD